MSNYKIITNLTEKDFFLQEENKTLQQGMYIFKDTENTAIVKGSKENAKISLKTKDIKEGKYSFLRNGLILIEEGEEKGYALYFRRGSSVYSIS